MKKSQVEQMVKESIEKFLTEGKVKKGEKTLKKHKAVIWFDKEDNEYTVKFYKNGEYQSEADYFTDDKDDAFGTAEEQLKTY